LTVLAADPAFPAGVSTVAPGVSTVLVVSWRSEWLSWLLGDVALWARESAFPAGVSTLGSGVSTVPDVELACAAGVSTVPHVESAFAAGLSALAAGVSTLWVVEVAFGAGVSTVRVGCRCVAGLGFGGRAR
jgi:hypothetical protein